MKTKSKITALLLVVLMLFAQVPFTVFAEETTTNTLTPDTLENGAEDIRWSWEFTYSGSDYIDSVRISKGELPDGVCLNSPSWTWFMIYGTPTKAGTYSFTIEVKNKNGEVLTKDYTLEIERDFPLEISTDHLGRGYVGSEYTNDVYLTYNRRTNNKWKLEDADGNVLPEGLTIDEDNGNISWPSPKAGKYNLKITVTRKEKTVSKVLKLIVEPDGGCTHPEKEKTSGKAATCKENGTRDYWYCDDCEHYYYNEACTAGGDESLGKIYTTAFHEDANDDGKCDTCGRTMPIFKKVTNTNEVTSCGMYLVVSKIDGKYYTLKIPEEEYGILNIDAVAIAQNTNGTFSYPKQDSDVMILNTSFAAACTALDAGKPRYGLGTNIEGLPYGLTGDDYSNYIQMYTYPDSAKYGWRINLTEDENAEIASVYSEYWGGDESDGTGKEKGSSGGNSGGLLSAYKETTGETVKQYFSFETYETASDDTASDDAESGKTETDDTEGGETENNETKTTWTSYPIELYKLTYADTVGISGTVNYTLDDAHSTVTINSGFTALDSCGSKTLSTAGGLSNAVKPSYVKDVIAEKEITGKVSARTYAKIELTSGTTTTNEWGYTDINSVRYSVTPMLKITNASSETLYDEAIDDENFDGSEMTVSLCIGTMTNPKQIIHHKTDGTKEYFYNERYDGLQAGQKTFSFDEGSYTDTGTTGHFVTFTIDSFSDIEVLDTAVAEEHGTKTTMSENGSKFTVLGNNIDGYTVILALYKTDSDGNSRLVECQTAVYDGKAKPFTTTATDYTSAKVMVWKSLTNIEPVTEVEKVNLGESD